MDVFISFSNFELRKAVEQILERQPEPRISGLLESFEELEKSSGKKLLEATRSGDHIAVCKLLEQNPDCVKGVTLETRETALHIAVRNGDLKMVELLLQHLRRNFYYNHIADMMDAGGDTVLHLAVARKQLQTVQLLLEKESADRCMFLVNAKNRGRFRALDVLDVLPESGEIDMKIERTLRRAGALSTRELSDGNKHETEITEHNFNTNDHEILIEFEDPFHLPRYVPLQNRGFPLLIVAAMVATMTFHAALRQPSFMNSNNNVYKEEDAVWNHLFVLFNSAAFFASVAFITVMTHELPVKPWLHISVFSAIGAYICSVMAISPDEVARVIFIGISTFVAAFLKALHKKMLHNMQWLCARIHLFRTTLSSYKLIEDMK